MSKIRATGRFKFTVRDLDGNVVGEQEFPNAAVTVGLNHMLDTEFHGSSAVTTWYIGLIDSSGFSALAAADTMGSHAGWAESTAYTEGVRQTWAEGAASGGVTTNSSPAVYTASGSVTIRGAFLASSSTKGETSSVLFSTGLAASPQALTVGQTLSVTYTVSLAGVA